MASKELDTQTHPETTKIPEQYDVLFGGLTISGQSGTGKTSLSENLQHVLNVPQFFNTGELFRELIDEERGEEVIGYQDRMVTLDKKLDTKQRQLLLSATPEHPLILEGRLAGIITNQLRQEAVRNDTQAPNIVTILLTAKSEIRYKRILQRQKLKDSSLSLTKVRKLTHDREKQDRKQWGLLHPELKKIDPFNPSNRLPDGEPMYDLIIDTNNKNSEEVLEEVLRRLEERGSIKPKKRENGDLKTSEPQLYPIFP